MEKYVIFSIDDVNDTHKQAKFLRHIDSAFHMGKMSGKMVHCIGAYLGDLEPSYIMQRDDFDKLVRPFGFVDGQESFLRVSACNKQYATLEFQNGDLLSIGSLKSVSKAEAMQQDAWTYRPDLNIYWIAVSGNPDTVRNG